MPAYRVSMVLGVQTVVSDKRPWGRRIRAVLTHPIKLPGWAAVLLAAIQVVPDWKSRLDFWLEVAKGTGGYLAMGATVVASPYFTPILLAGGLLWILFAGEPPKGVQRHHWLRYVGWSVFLICFTMIVLSAGWGAIEFYIKQEVSHRDEELQKKYGTHPVLWHLTDLQRTALGNGIDQVPESQRFPIVIQCLPDAGSRTYVEDIGKVFNEHNWKNITGDLSPNFHPAMGRVPASFEPMGLGGATGRGAEPSV